MPAGGRVRHQIGRGRGGTNRTSRWFRLRGCAWRRTCSTTSCAYLRTSRRTQPWLVCGGIVCSANNRSPWAHPGALRCERGRKRGYWPFRAWLTVPSQQQTTRPWVRPHLTHAPKPRPGKQPTGSGMIAADCDQPQRNKNNHIVGNLIGYQPAFLPSHVKCWGGCMGRAN